MPSSFQSLKKIMTYSHDSLKKYGVYAPELQISIRLLLGLCYIAYYYLMPEKNKVYPLNFAIFMALCFMAAHLITHAFILINKKSLSTIIKFGNWLDLIMAHFAWLSDPVQPSPLMAFISIAVIGNGMQLGIVIFRKNAPLCVCLSLIIFLIRTFTYGFNVSELFLSAFLFLMMLYAYLLLVHINRLKKSIEANKLRLEETVIERTSELQKSNDLLREEVKTRKKAEREARLKQAQLLQATKMASLGTLIAGLAHEINNPVSVISMNISNVKKFCTGALKVMDDWHVDHEDGIVCNMKYGDLRARLPLILAGLDEGVARITKLVEDLRVYARQQPWGFFETLNISEAILKSIRLTNCMIKKSTRNFVVEIPDYIPSVRGDINKIEQVIINLITNACQALEMPEQGISIKAGVMVELGMVFVSISDEGKGMTAALIEKIKTPFFTTRRHKDGTGLGLSISDTIIAEHGGTLNFESTPGKGTTAKIILPFLKEEVDKTKENYL